MQLHLHCLFPLKAYVVWDFFNRPICNISFQLCFVWFFFNEQVYLMASLNTKAAKGELFPKTGGLKVEAGCLDRAGRICAKILILQDQDSMGLFLENS